MNLLNSDQFLGNNRIWQQNDTYCYTLPDGTYKKFQKKITNQQLKYALAHVDYYNTYRKYVKKNGTKFGVLDNVRMYPFAVLFNTWVYSNLACDVKEFIPDYDAFCSFYIANYCHPVSNASDLTFNNNACEELVRFSDTAMRVRIGYTYGSFLREFYLKNCLLEYFEALSVGINVCYSIHDDYYNAIDILLEKDGRYLGVCVLDDSKNSKQMKFRKDTIRHQTFNNNIFISNRDGFVKDKASIPRMNFYTDVFNKDKTEQVGEIMLPKMELIHEFADKAIEYFKN